MGYYAKEQPRDRLNETYQNAPPATTSNQSQNGVPLTSSVVTLSDKTTVFEVTAFSGTAGGGAVIGKWGPASVTGTNFDFIVQSGNTRTFIVPQSVFGVNSVAGANVANGLYSTVALKNATAQSTSVFTIEY